VLLDGRLRLRRLELLDVCGDRDRLELLEHHAAALAPGREGDDGRAYAIRVFLFRMFAVKNSQKRLDVFSPASRKRAGVMAGPWAVTAIEVGGSAPGGVRSAAELGGSGATALGAFGPAIDTGVAVITVGVGVARGSGWRARRTSWRSRRAK